MTNDRPIHSLNYQWQASIHFNWLMVGQYDVIFIGTIKSLNIWRFDWKNIKVDLWKSERSLILFLLIHQSLYKRNRMSVFLCVCLQLKILVTTKPIRFSFLWYGFLLGPWRIYHKLGGGYLHPSKRNHPWKKYWICFSFLFK